VPTIGAGAGPECDAQVLVWTDMAGLNRGRVPKFVKRYADLGGVLADAAERFAADVRAGSTRTRSTPATDLGCHWSWEQPATVGPGRGDARPHRRGPGDPADA
jgi:hypothetical protein